MNSIPIPSDFEGVGRADFAVFSPSQSNFYIKLSSGSTYVRNFGMTGDIPIPNDDYFSTGRAAIEVFRPSTATFYAFDMVTSSVKSNQYGSAVYARPVLAPITTWFTFGSITSHVMSVPSNAVTTSATVTSAQSSLTDLTPNIVEVEPPASLSAQTSTKRQLSAWDLALNNFDPVSRTV